MSERQKALLVKRDDDRLELRDDEHAEPKPDELATLRLQLADARRIIAEWQNINTGLAAELKRERERSEARLRTIRDDTIKSLERQLNAVIEAEHRLRCPEQHMEEK
jgi:hypothetical protein